MQIAQQISLTQWIKIQFAVFHHYQSFLSNYYIKITCVHDKKNPFLYNYYLPISSTWNYFTFIYVITTGKFLTFWAHPKQGQFMPSYAIGINFNCNDFLLNLNDVRRVNMVYRGLQCNDFLLSLNYVTLNIVFWALLCTRHTLLDAGEPVVSKNTQSTSRWPSLSSGERWHWSKYTERGINVAGYVT